MGRFDREFLYAVSDNRSKARRKSSRNGAGGVECGERRVVFSARNVLTGAHRQTR
jgi:hypothetical protein